MADNVRLSAGTNDGATMRTLDTGAYQIASTTLAYATTLAPGANVVVDVTTTNRLPVSATLVGSLVVDAVVAPVVVQSDPSAPFLVKSITDPVSLATGQTIAATQSGSWSVSITGSPAVSISGTPTVAVAAGQTIAATQSGSWDVSILGTPAVSISGTPAVAQSGSWTVAVAAGQTLANVTNVATVGTITDPVGLAAGTNLVGRVAAGDDVAGVYSGATPLTLKRAKATATASGITPIVAAVAGKSILVLRYVLRFNSTVSATFRSGASTDLSAPFYGVQYGVNGGAACKYGHYATAAGEALNLNLASAGTVAVDVLYVEV